MVGRWILDSSGSGAQDRDMSRGLGNTEMILRVPQRRVIPRLVE